MKFFNTAKRKLIVWHLTWKAAKETDHLEAIKLCEKLRSFENEQDTLARSMLAWTHHKLGDKVKAINYGNQVLNVDPFNILILKLLIRIYFEQKEHAIVYGYVQRVTSYALDSEIKTTKIALIRWIGILAPWFSMAPKLRVVLPEMEQALKNDCNYESEWLRWARGYKQWYEERLSLGKNCIPPEETWN